MKGFLDEVAEYLVKQHNSEDLQNMIMVLPSKRGGIYLKKALARVFPTPLISPVIYSLEEFVLIATESELMGPTDLLLEAYSCFKAVEPNLELDKFMGWGPIMLKDFDTLDMYLVPPKDLFDYLSEAKSIDRWAEELGTEDKAELITPNTQAYFKLHENLLEVYARLQSRLKDKKQFYRGQLFRKLVKNLVEGKKLPMDFSKLYFLGFNALSKSEEEIIRRILATTNAEILWDADSYYVNDPYHRAGFWLRNYANPRKKEFLAKNEFLWLGENYQNQEKEVSIVKVKNTSTQVYWAINKILEWEKNYGKEEDIALVLGDEQLLGSFLDYLGYFQDRLNITMGYPLRKTHIFNLLEDFWEMLISKDPGRFDRGLVDKVLKNPLLRVYLNLKDWDNQNLNEFPLYIPEEKLSQLSKEIPIFLYLFPEKTIGFREILISLGKLCYELIKVLPENSMKEQVEAIFMVKESLEKIAISFEGQELSDLKVGRSFLRQYLSGLKLSFEGQVKRTLNVMGLLETRTLDFDRVIILSVNEEILPRSSSRDSLIPYDIATMKAFDLPTRTQADAVTSYHFHRLLQRPKEIILLSVIASESGKSKEESRFIQQLRLEWPKINSKLVWKEYTVSPQFERNEKIGLPIIEIEKSYVVLDKIKFFLTKRGLSPSSFSNLIDCTLKFYWSNVLGVREDKKEEEEIGNDSFGVWVHKVLENGNKELIEKGSSYSKEWFLDRIQNIESHMRIALNDIKREYGSFDVERGFNFVLGELAKKTLVNYYQIESQKTNFSKPIAAEISLDFKKKFEIGGEVLDIIFKGFVDLIDLLGTEIRILDYKTGAMDTKDLESKDDQFKPKVFQLQQYYILLEESIKEEKIESLKSLVGKEYKITPGIISTRKPNSGIFKMNESDEFFNQENFLNKIKDHIMDLLDDQISISQTQDSSVCTYCSFIKICNK